MANLPTGTVTLRLQARVLMALVVIVTTCAYAEDAAADPATVAWLTPQALVVVPPE
jgi:hypothetical protein